MMRLLSFVLALLLSTAFIFAQNNPPPPTPFEVFAQGLYQEFVNAVPTLISVVGSIFVFSWLVTWIMRRVRAVSR